MLPRRVVTPVVAAGAAGALLLSGCSSVPASPAAAASAPAPGPRSFTVVAGGDVMVHDPVTAQAITDGAGAPDFGPQLAGLHPVVSAADLALCHLEVPLAPAGGPYAGYPRFSAPPELARALAGVGYDGCSTASNHALDQGPAGVTRTLDALDAVGLGHAGTARTDAEATDARVYEVAGARVAHLAATFGLNSGTTATAPWQVDLLDPPAVLAAAGRARAAGADVVVLSAHWGTEYSSEPDEDQLRLAPELLASPDIDLVVGHHAHVVQPFERIGDEWVAYGLGNQLAEQETPDTEDGALARFVLTEGPDGRWTVTAAEYVPTRTDPGPPIRVLDLTRGPHRPDTDAARARTAAAVGSRGAAAAGLRPAG